MGYRLCSCQMSNPVCLSSPGKRACQVWGIHHQTLCCSATCHFTLLSPWPWQSHLSACCEGQQAHSHLLHSFHRPFNMTPHHSHKCPWIIDKQMPLCSAHQSTTNLQVFQCWKVLKQLMQISAPLPLLLWKAYHQRMWDSKERQTPQTVISPSIGNNLGGLEVFYGQNILFLLLHLLLVPSLLNLFLWCLLPCSKTVQLHRLSLTIPHFLKSSLQ